MIMAVGRETARAWLGDVPEEKAFRCRDGRMIKNLDELAISLRDMSEEAFSHHATKDNNDFSNWIRDVIGDATLARQLQRAATNTTAARKVETRLGWLRAKL